MLSLLACARVFDAPTFSHKVMLTHSRPFNRSVVLTRPHSLAFTVQARRQKTRIYPRWSRRASEVSSKPFAPVNSRMKSFSDEQMKNAMRSPVRRQQRQPLLGGSHAKRNSITSAAAATASTAATTATATGGHEHLSKTQQKTRTPMRKSMRLDNMCVCSFTTFNTCIVCTHLT
jgi:hypothetical protein